MECKNVCDVIIIPSWWSHLRHVHIFIQLSMCTDEIFRTSSETGHDLLDILLLVVVGDDQIRPARLQIHLVCLWGESNPSINRSITWPGLWFIFQRLHKHNTFTVTVNVIKCPSSFKCENEDGKGFKKQYSINLIWVCSVMFYTWQSHVIVSSNITANQVPYANQYNGYQYNVDFLTLLFFFV